MDDATVSLRARPVADTIHEGVELALRQVRREKVWSLGAHTLTSEGWKPL